MDLIVAVDNKSGIAKNGEIPWKDSEDLAFFKTITYGREMVLGRKTAEQIGFLSGRYSIVLTRDEELLEQKYQNGHYTTYEKFVPDNQIVIGGLEIYNLFLPIVKTIYLTTIQGDFNCDKVFEIPPWFKRVSKFTLGSGSIVGRLENVKRD